MIKLIIEGELIFDFNNLIPLIHLIVSNTRKFSLLWIKVFISSYIKSNFIQLVYVCILKAVVIPNRWTCQAISKGNATIKSAIYSPSVWIARKPENDVTRIPQWTVILVVKSRQDLRDRKRGGKGNNSPCIHVIGYLRETSRWNNVSWI